MVHALRSLEPGPRRWLLAAALAGGTSAGLLVSPSSGAAAALSPAAVLAQQRATPKQMGTLRPTGANPLLSFLPVGATPNYDAWSRWMRLQAKGKRGKLAPTNPARLIATGESEPNGTLATADAVTGFGSAEGHDPAANVTGVLAAPAPPTVIGPFSEDNGAIPLASMTGLTNGASVKASGTIGDGPHGSAGSGSGDFDFLQVTGLSAGDQIVIDVDTPLPFSGDLDPFVALWDSAGTLIAFNDDGDPSVSYDSYLAVTVPAAGTYYVSIGAYLAPYPLNPFDPSSGTGFASEGTYDVTLGVNASDIDFFAVELKAGDVIAGNLVGPFGSKLTLFDAAGGERIGSTQDATFIEPGSFPGGGAAAFAYVVESTGTHAVRVSGPSAPYTLELRVFRPELEQQLAGAVQTIFVDFDGASVDPAIFGGLPGSATLSPLSSFLAGWGLAPGDESDLIDAILVVIEENLSSDMRVLGLNGNFDVSSIPGDFDVVLLNSRDHADPFGDPNVSRIIIGGTIPELGIGTIGIAQSIDPGNFATSETGVVLLDLLSGPAFDPNSLNQFGLAGGATTIDLVARGVGNIAAHEAGHFFGNFHSDQYDASPNIMDQGGNLPNTVGVGSDLTLGSSDDVDVDFGDAAYVPNEGFTGMEDTLNAVAFGLSTGAQICPVVPLGSCRPAVKTSLQIKNTSPDANDLLVFKWTKGDSTTQTELGHPTNSATYRLCVYDATGLVRSATAPAGGLCAGKPCWKQLGPAANPNGLKYSDKELTPTGTQSVTLKSGSSPKPKATWKAKGDALGDSSLGLVPPVVVEIGNSETSVCLGSTYGAPDVLANDSLQFRAKTQ